MTWETFDAEWDEEVVTPDTNLPYSAAYTRDDGFRLEFYTFESRRIVELSDNATKDVLSKAEVVLEDTSNDGVIVGMTDVEGWPREPWVERPSLVVAALRYAARVWV